MFRDYSYDYEWDVEYCYPNSNVLRNKLNITSPEALAEAEREITSLPIPKEEQLLAIRQFFGAKSEQMGWIKDP